MRGEAFDFNLATVSAVRVGPNTFPVYQRIPPNRLIVIVPAGYEFPEGYSVREFTLQPRNVPEKLMVVEAAGLTLIRERPRYGK